MTLTRILALIAAAWMFAVSGSESAASDQSDMIDPAAFPEIMAGNWALAVEVSPGPGQESMRFEGRAHARWLGEQWLVAESSGEAGEQTYTWIFTLGYMPHVEEFVATWVDSRQSYLWDYSGTLDESGRAVTLETKGPIMGNPEMLGEFRVIVEIIDDDHWVMRSSILGPDGEWFEFTRVDFQREG